MANLRPASFLGRQEPEKGIGALKDQADKEKQRKNGEDEAPIS